MAYDPYSGLEKFEGAYDNTSTGYDAIQGDDLLSDTRFLKDLRYVYENDIDHSVSSDISDEELLDHYYSDMRAKSANTVSAGFDMFESSQASGELAEARGRVQKAWDRAPTRGSTMGMVGEYLLYGAMDPLNYIPGFAVGKMAYKGAFAAARKSGKSVEEATELAQKALRNKKTLARQVGADAGVNAGIGAGFETMQQFQQAAATGEDVDLNFANIGQAALQDGAIGAAISVPASVLTRGMVERDALADLERNPPPAPRVEPVFDNNPPAEETLGKTRESLTAQLDDLRAQYNEVNQRLPSATSGDESNAISIESSEILGEVRVIQEKLQTYDSLEELVDALRQDRQFITKELSRPGLPPEDVADLQRQLDQINDEIAKTQKDLEYVLSDQDWVPEFDRNARNERIGETIRADILARRDVRDSRPDQEVEDAYVESMADETSNPLPQREPEPEAPLALEDQSAGRPMRTIILPSNLPSRTRAPLADDIETPVIRENISQSQADDVANATDDVANATDQTSAQQDVEVTPGAQKLIDKNDGLTVDMITQRNKDGKITQQQVRQALKDPEVVKAMGRIADTVADEAPTGVEVEIVPNDSVPVEDQEIAQLEQDAAMLRAEEPVVEVQNNAFIDEAVELFAPLMDSGNSDVTLSANELRSILAADDNFSSVVDQIMDRLDPQGGTQQAKRSKLSISSFDQLADLLGVERSGTTQERRKKVLTVVTDGGEIDLSPEANNALADAVLGVARRFSESRGQVDIPKIPLDIVQRATEGLSERIANRRRRLALQKENYNKTPEGIDALALAGETKKVEDEIIEMLRKNNRTSTAKGMDALETNPEAGRSPKRVPNQETGTMEWTSNVQSFLRPGRDIGDGYTITGSLGNFTKGRMDLDLLRLNLSAIKKAGKEVAAINKFKVNSPITTDQATVKRKDGRTYQSKATLTPGATGFYVSSVDRVYADYDAALNAAGLAKSKTVETELNYEIPTASNSVELEAGIEMLNKQFAIHQNPSRLMREKAQLRDSYNRSISDAPEIGPTGESFAPTSGSGIPVKKPGKRLALFPKNPNKTYANGRRITTRVIQDYQIKAGKTVEDIAGSSLADFHIGYVPDEFANRTKAGDTDLVREVFEPLDEANTPINAEQAANELANSRPSPINFDDAVTKNVRMGSLTNPERYAFADALKMTKRVSYIQDMNSFMNQEFNLVVVNRLISDVESLPWSASDADGTGIAYARRLNTLSRLNDVLTREAPGGLRGDTKTIGQSLEQLKNISGKASAKTLAQVGQLLRALNTDVYPKFQKLYGSDDAHAQFLINEGSGRVIDQNGDSAFNAIQMRPAEDLSDFENGDLGHAFTTLHEIGHWVWQNVLLPEDKAMFWSATGKFYNENGDLLPTSAREILDKSPLKLGKDGSIFGFSNAADTPMEYFANQFALYVSNQREMVSIADKTMWDRITGIVRELWNKMTGREIVDKDLIPLFSKIVRDDAESARMSLSNPVEPTSDFTRIIRSRYAELKQVRESIDQKIDDEDFAGLVDSLRDLSSRLMSMAATKQDAKQIARATGDEYRTEYTGSFGPIRMYAPAMREMARKINRAVGERGSAIDPETGEITTTITPESEEAIRKLVSDESFDVKRGDVVYSISFDSLLDDVANQLNTVYRNAESGGDIPEWSSSTAQQIKVRRGKVVKPGAKRGSQFWRMVNKANKNRKERNREAATSAKNETTEKKTASQKDSTPANANSGVDLSALSTDQLLQRMLNEKNASTYTLMSREVIARAQTSDKINISDMLDPSNYKKTRPYMNVKTNNIVMNMVASLRFEDSVQRKQVLLDGAREIKLRKYKKDLNKGQKAVRSTFGPSNPVLESAIKSEQMAMQDTVHANGLIENLGFKAREALQAITHRDPVVEHSARKILLRLNALGVEFPIDVSSPEFSNLRTELRRAASILTKSDDITPALDVIAKMLLRSEAIGSEGISSVRDLSAATSIDPDEVVSRLLREDIDVTSNNRLVDTIGDTFTPESGKIQTIDQARLQMIDLAAYVTRGLVTSKTAGDRFTPLFAHGDPLDASVNQVLNTAGSGRSSVAPEFASDFIEEMRDVANIKTLDRIDDWATRTDLVAEQVSRTSDPDAVRPISDGDLGTGVYLTKSSAMTADSTPRILDLMDQSVDNADVFDAGNKILYVRDQIKRLKIKARASQAEGLDQYNDYAEMTRLENIEEAALQVLEQNDVDTNLFVAPFAANVKNVAQFGTRHAQKKTVGPVADIVAVAMSEGRIKSSKILDALDNAPEDLTGEQALQLGIEILGSADEVNKALRKTGYDAIETDEMMVVFDSLNAKHMGSSYFSRRTSNYEGQQPVTSPTDTAVSGILNGKPLAQAFDESSEVLQQSGVSPALISKLKRKALGKPVEFDPNDMKEIRQVLTFETNGGILRKSGMSFLADFFEPQNGAGGHFERINVQLGKRIVPILTALNKLPDTKNGMLRRWWNRGFRQMGESFLPLPPETQPASHARIVQSLRTGSVMNLKSKEERVIRDQFRNLFNETLDRLRNAGVHMGNIGKDNYFPQVWRKDLIESDMESFVDRLASYFQAEHVAREGDQLQGMPREAALSIARKVALKLVDEDGVAPPVNKFSGGGREITLDQGFERMIRLDKFNDFVDPTNPNDLSQFLENDLGVIATKYMDSAERRIEMNDTFGINSHAFYDYLEVAAGSADGDITERVMRLLTSSKVFRATRDTADAEGRVQSELSETVFSSLLPATDQGRESAYALATELVDLAKSGRGAKEIEDILVSTHQGDATQKMNFAKRARAIANALVDTEGGKKKVHPNNIQHAMDFYKTAMRKPISMGGLDEKFRNPSKFLRAFNMVTLLSYTVVTSLTDVVLPLINSGDFRSFAAGWKDYVTKGPEYREFVAEIGASIENVVHQRMTHTLGTDSSKFANGFFTATMLEPWTAMNREISASIGYNFFKMNQKLALNQPNTRDGRLAKQRLDTYGLTSLYAPTTGKPDSVEAIMSGDSFARDEIATAIIKFTNEAIFTPNPNDIPVLANTPIGSLIFQLKSFPLMMSRLGGRTIRKATRKDGTKDYAPLFAFLGIGPAYSAGVVATKDIVQARNEENENAVRERTWNEGVGALPFVPDVHEDYDAMMGWYADGMLQMGGLGLLGDILYNSAEQIDNGAYGRERIYSTFLGPTFGLASDTIKVAEGALDGNASSNSKERVATREVLQRIPILGGRRDVRESLVDSIAGESSKSRNRSATSGVYSFGYKYGYDFN